MGKKILQLIKINVTALVVISGSLMSCLPKQVTSKEISEAMDNSSVPHCVTAAARLNLELLPPTLLQDIPVNQALLVVLHPSGIEGDDHESIPDNDGAAGVTIEYTQFYDQVRDGWPRLLRGSQKLNTERVALWQPYRIKGLRVYPKVELYTRASAVDFLLDSPFRQVEGWQGMHDEELHLLIKSNNAMDTSTRWYEMNKPWCFLRERIGSGAAVK